MKFIVTLSIAIFSFLPAVAQEIPQGYCGTSEYMEQQRTSLEYIQQNMHPSLLAQPDVTYFLPIKFHIVGQDNGSGKADLSKVLETLCAVNENFSGTGIQFYLGGDVHFINNSDFYSHDYQAGGQMMVQNNVSGKINVYVVQNAAGNCGYYSPFADAVAVNKGCLNEPSTTLAHELGHYLSLPHTFHGWESGTPAKYKQERADGSNCNTAGDGFCDTPADYVSDRWNCPYNGDVLIDPVGDTVIPDETQIMSYSLDYCQTHFSSEQEAAMRYYVKVYKQGLAASFVPYNGPVSTTGLISPVDNQHEIPGNPAEFSWKSVPNAYAYQIQISRFKAMANNTVDEVILDTTYSTSELLSGADYYWRVRPLARRNTCTDFTGTEEFSISQVTGIAENPQVALAIYPNPVKGGQQLNVELKGRSNAHGTVELVDLSGKVIDARHFKGSSLRLNTYAATKGVYLLRINANDFTAVRRISIQ